MPTAKGGIRELRLACRRARRIRAFSLVGMALGALLVSRVASAYDARVDASFDAQFYTLASPFGAPYIYRRRATSTLSLDVDGIDGAELLRRRSTPRLSFRSRLRMDVDYGQNAAERDPSTNQFVPGLAQGPLDVMYAYLEGRGYAGVLNFRFGRQYLIDALGYWSFDGALLEVELPLQLALSGFVGFEQRSGIPMLAGSRFSSDGVWRGSRSGLESPQYPAFLDDAALAPARGVALETFGLRHFHARFSYRKVENRATVLVSQYANLDGSQLRLGGTRTSSERVGGSARLDWPQIGSLTAKAAYDIYNRAFSDALLSLDCYAPSDIVVGADVDYYYPTFDADSIFNFFTHHGMTSALGRVGYAPPRAAFDASASLGARWYVTSGDPSSYASERARGTASTSPSLHPDWVGQAAARYRFGPGSVSLGLSAQHGDSGHLLGSDVTTRRTFLGGRYDVLLTTSLYDWSDALRSERSATSFSYVAGVGLHPGNGFFSRSRLGIEWEHSMNRLVGQRFRLLLTLGFTVFK